MISLFQFQLGTIGTPRLPQRGWSYFISIPVRYDWNLESIFVKEPSIKISIPVRYDWNAELLRTIQGVLAFQFQLGTIGTLF